MDKCVIFYSGVFLYDFLRFYRLKMKKFDIRKTFDIFLREPISVLTEGLFQLVNIENNIFSQKPYVNVDFVNRKTQITVVNSEKMYNLFQKVLFKKKLQEQKEKALNSK